MENRIFLTREDQIDPDGIAVALVDIEDIDAWQASEFAAACASQGMRGLWAWRVSHVRPIGGCVRAEARRKLDEMGVSDALFSAVM